MSTAAASRVCNRRSAPSVGNRRSAQDVGTADRGVLNLVQYKKPRAHKDAHFLSSRLPSPPPLRPQKRRRRRRHRTHPPPPLKRGGGGSGGGGGHRSIAEALARYTAESGLCNLLLGSVSLSWVNRFQSHLHPAFYIKFLKDTLEYTGQEVII